MAAHRDDGVAEDGKKTEHAGRVADPSKPRLAAIEAGKAPPGPGSRPPPETDEDYRALLDRLPIGVYRTTPDGKILFANATMVRLLGCRTFLELADRNLHGAVYEPDYTRDWFKTEMLKEGQIRSLETNWTCSDGTVLRVRENARAVRARDGSILHYEGTVEDVSASGESNEMLRAKADFLEEVVTNASVGIFVIDEDNRYVLINPECGRIVGHWPDDWTGKEAGLNVHPEDQGKALAHFIQALSGESNDFEARIQAADGSYKHCRVNISPMMLGGRAHVLGLVSDVTGRRSAEQELMQKRTYGLNTILVLAISSMARAIPPGGLEPAMQDFQGRFARGFQTLFEDDMQIMGSHENPDGLGTAGREAVFKRFLRFYSSLLYIMGVRTEHSQVLNEATFEILDCLWLNDARESPVPCRVCRTILCDSFRWTGLNGTAEPAATQAAGAKTCVFKFHMGPMRRQPEQVRLPNQ